jgi:hypothetical protein
MLTQRTNAISFPRHRFVQQTGGYNDTNKQSTYTLQTSRLVFDPEASTPPSDFMKSLSERMGVYFTATTSTGLESTGRLSDSPAYNANNWLQK